ncbi:response regulator [Psychrosphaera aquimarina]|uniref:histidine kinase n=1 Tax=Psychrosphaera aquimarina TaxID=2044854 RepID=A0ABU3QZK6_9GAMM|nr:response regulator [Psychrosphaera aquimarina]MDU0112869.1 response regulator [Psychrosphaera aquimarina]
MSHGKLTGVTTSINPLLVRFLVVSIIIFLSGLYVAVWSEKNTENQNKSKLNEQINKELVAVSADILSELSKYEQALHGLRGTIKTVKLEDFTHKHHQEYFHSRDYKNAFPGSRGFGVIKKVGQDELVSFLENAAKDRDGKFRLKQLDNPQDPLFIIQYIEPEKDNLQAIGLDIGSEQNRRMAAIKAAVSNTTQLTGPITLVQADNKVKHGFLLLLPIQTARELNLNQKSDFNAWVYSPLLINEILDSVSSLNTNFQISISDVYLKQETNFFNSEVDSEINKRYALTNSLEVFGRNWLITLSPTINYIDSLELTPAHLIRNQVIFVSLLLSIFMFFIGRTLSKRFESITRKLSYAAVVENTSESIIAVDKDFLVLHWNHAAEDLFNKLQHLEKTRSVTLLEWLKPYIKQAELVSYFKQVSRGESILNLPFVVKNAESETAKQLQISLIPLMKNSSFLGATVSISDITKLIQLQNDLKIKNELLEQQVTVKSGEVIRKAQFQSSVLNSSHTAIIATNMDGVISLINQSAQDLLKLNENDTVDSLNIIELIQSTFFDSDEHSNFSKWVAKLLEHNASTLVTFCNHNIDLDVPIELTTSTILDEFGKASGYVFLAEDIRETLSLKRHVSLINSALDNSQDVLFWLDPQGHIIHLNNFANIQLGYTNRSVQYQSINEIIIYKEDESWEALKNNIDDNSRISIERSYQQSSGQTIPMLISCCKLMIDDDVFYYFAGKNISLRLIEETKLKTALSNVDAASKSKSTFISKMSHELRTPLNIANGMLQMLELTVLSDIQRTSVDGAKQSMRHLTYIIDDIMDLSDAERGLLTLENTEFVFDEVLDDIGFHLSNLIGDKPLEVHFDIDADVPLILLGDEKKLHQVILNIATNAVKFSLEGEVIIRISVERLQDSKVTLLFSITDSGIGIEPEKLEKIFELFSQSDDSSARHYGGLGVGLSIAHQFVNLMGGELTVVSKKGVGSTFSFNIDLVEVDTPNSLIPVSINKSLNVLLVDDNITALNVLGNTIKLLGWQVSVASSAEDGLRLFQQGLDNNKAFDLVLVDWKMPDVDGWQLAEKIRDITPVDNVPLLIMVSALSRQRLAEKAAESKSLLNGFISKPVTRTMLVEAITDAVSASEHNAQIPKVTKKEKSLLNKQILVVEDNPANQLIARTLLESQGALVVVASGGLIALEELNNYTFDFILMDIQMPDLDGYETTRRIRAHEQYLTLPIYAMTANVSDKDVKLCFEAGMDGHIAKPFQINKVVEIILEATSGVNTLTSVAISNKKVQDCLTNEAIEYCVNKNIDIENCLARFNYLNDLYKRSLVLFLDDLNVELIKLSASVNKRIEQDDFILFHTLKSTSESLGFKQLGELTKEIEHQIEQKVFESDEELSKSQFANVHQLMKQTADDVQGLLHLLLPNKESEKSNLMVNFEDAFSSLYEDVLGFNLNAIDTYHKIEEPLKSISKPLSEKLVACLNKLQFNEAKLHLDALKKLLMEE